MATIVIRGKSGKGVLTGTSVKKIVRRYWGLGASLRPVKGTPGLYEVIKPGSNLALAEVYPHESGDLALAQREALARVREQAMYVRGAQEVFDDAIQRWNDSVRVALTSGATHQLVADATGLARNSISSRIKRGGLTR